MSKSDPWLVHHGLKGEVRRLILISLTRYLKRTAIARTRVDDVQDFAKSMSHE